MHASIACGGRSTSEQRDNHRFQRRQITFNDSPDQREVHAEVIVCQTIAHTRDLLLRDLRTLLLRRIGKLLDGLANDLELTNHSILAHPLGHERRGPPMCTLRCR
jgi:hypothetical protein